MTGRAALDGAIPLKRLCRRHVSLGELAEGLRALAAHVKAPDVIALDVAQVIALAALLDTCRTTTDEGVLARAVNLKDTLILGDPS